MYERSRAEGFGAEVKRRILVGTYVLSHGYYDAYYIQAQNPPADRRGFPGRLPASVISFWARWRRRRRLIWEKSDDPVQMYLSDIYTLAVNLAGLPGMSLPAGLPTMAARWACS